MTTWIVLLTGALFGAGFDCAKASHPVEERICSDSILSKLDDSLALAWKSTLSTFGAVGRLALLREQKEWLASIRHESPPSPELRRAWHRRLGELALKRSAKSLSVLVGGLSEAGVVRLETPGSCGRMDMETGEPIECAAVDVLELWVLPGSGRLRFRLVANVDQPQCHSCEVEAEVPSGKSTRRPWVSGEGESRASGALSIFADSVVVEVAHHNQAFHCGMGASLGAIHTFHRQGLRIASPPEQP